MENFMNEGDMHDSGGLPPPSVPTSLGIATPDIGVNPKFPE